MMGNESEQNSLDAKRFAFGRDDLGPVIASFLQKLWETSRYFEQTKNAKILFCARAGVRIRQALEVYMGRVDHEVPDDWEILWVSRMMIAKGIWRQAPETSKDIFSKEFKYTAREIAVDCIVGGKPSKTVLDKAFSMTPPDFAAITEDQSEKFQLLNAHLEEQSWLFEEKTTQLLNGKDCALLIDTGWMATSQRLLSKGMPEIDWWGAYFGLSAIEQEHEPRHHWSQAVGLMFTSDTVQRDVPETSILEFRHIIESLFEPKAPSIERYLRTNDGAIIAEGEVENLADRENAIEDPIFGGVMEALTQAPKDPAEVAANAQAAWLRLQKFILTPSRAQTEVYQATKRSADFGRDLSVDVLLPIDERTPEERVRDSLWTAGQIALENEDGMADAILRKRFGLSHGLKRTLKMPGLIDLDRPAVAVITRTMDRPMLLRRALLSVHDQTFRDYVQVVVCDGGDIAFVRDAIRDTNIDHSKILLVDNVENRGMEAASNIAISASGSEYIVIHDDDDTWHPEFLNETVGFLSSDEGVHFGGVLTKSIYVSEEIAAEGIKVHNTWPYRPDLKPPTFHQIMAMNTFAPISFLFRRACYDKIGAFREDYPVLGDWEFNLRFLEEFDIAVIDRELAFYHHRDVGDNQTFGNSVIAGRDKHAKQLSIMQNEFLRRSEKSGKSIAGASALNLTVGPNHR